MKVIRKAFLLWVGIIAVTYEETSKLIEKRREALKERLGMED